MYAFLFNFIFETEQVLGSLVHDGSNTNSSSAFLALSLDIGGEKVDLNLEQVTDLEPDLPVYTVSSVSGSVQIQRTMTSPTVKADLHGW
jgi:hypothetical protein